MAKPPLRYTAEPPPDKMVLPPGMTPVRFMEEFAGRFPLIYDDILTHIARVTKLNSVGQAQQVGDTLGRMEVEGKIQFAISAGGEPAVFTSRAKIPDEERALADALVTYFDSTGTFNEHTGEVVDPAGRHTRLAEVETEVRRTTATIAAMASLSAADYRALAILCEAMGIPSMEMVKLLSQALEEIGPEKAAEAGAVEGIVKSLALRWSEQATGDTRQVRLVLRDVVAVYARPVAATLDEWLAEEYPTALDVFARELHASKRIIREILDRWTNTGVVEFIRSPQPSKDGTFAISGLLPQGWPVFVSRTERGLKEIFEKQFRMLEVMKGADGEPLVTEHRPEPSPSPHRTSGYSLALMAQFAALVKLEKLINLSSEALNLRASDWSLESDYEEVRHRAAEWLVDLRAARGAATFCWFEDQTRAVEYAASTCPDSVRLTRDMTDVEAGWWYYLAPRPIRTISDASAPITALLWSWVDNGQKRGLRITAMVPDGDGLSVSTVGFWPEGMTLGRAVQEAQTQYRMRYRGSTENLIGEEATVAAIEWMYRFFWMGCFWMKQRIPVLRQQGMKPQIERHERKRMERVFQRPLGDIQVIHLRKKESVNDPTMPAEERQRAREYGCRWVVKGFVRNQFFPSTGAHKPIWIDSYVKGPEGKPMKVPSHTVYVVNR